MTLFEYFTYASVTAILALIVILIALSVKSWLDEISYIRNFLFVHDMNELWYERDMKRMDSFDSHVASTPGMQNLN